MTLIECKNNEKGRPARKPLTSLIPLDILENEKLNEAISQLPRNYNFEIHKTVWQLKKNKVASVALQFPEGLLLYAPIISDILERFADVQTVILGDVTYGACCIDDFTAFSLGCDYMVHYGHSCLVPVDVTRLKVLYVFVSITFDVDKVVTVMRDYFPVNSSITLVSTVQFISALTVIQQELMNDYKIVIPQSKPLSPGEILGCTAPRVVSDYILYVGDGRFHLEAMMISNPTIPAFRYDPYANKFSKEYFDFNDLHDHRLEAIENMKAAKTIGLILSTLGRQGNPRILDNLKKVLTDRNKKFIIVLISEITPSKLSSFGDVDAWIQVACPRLSIDWGYAFDKPILTPYEANVAFGNIDYQSVYPMDYYAKESLGNWTNYHASNQMKNIYSK